MKREEKNQQTQRRILDSALAEFSSQGYGASSINTISNAQGLSKGIIYHYFETKDSLYLACVEECFQALTGYMQAHAQLLNGTAAEQLASYFGKRLTFFQENPFYQRLFCEAVMTPPAHLVEGIVERKKPFDSLNLKILSRLLEPLALRPDVSKEEVLELFGQYQDFINARSQMTGNEPLSIYEHEKKCQRALELLLHGVLAREERN